MRTSRGFAESPFSRWRRYSGVYHQQGRVETDSDWNEDSADRTGFARLADGLRAAIPVHSPEWTDHQQSDPGIPLLELFAFLASAIGYVASVRWLWNREGSMRRIVTVVVDGEEWSQVGNLDDSGPDAKEFRLDPVTGAVEFGDGVHGKVPEAGVSLSTRYTHGARATAVGAFVLMVWTGRILWRSGRRKKRRP